MSVAPIVEAKIRQWKNQLIDVSKRNRLLYFRPTKTTTLRLVAPGPFLPANVVAAALAASGSTAQQAEVLPMLVSGEAIAAWAFAESSSGPEKRRAYRARDTSLQRHVPWASPRPHGQGFVAPTYEAVSDDSLRLGITRFTNPFNALGWPALALPCGVAEHGLPASIQLVGRTGADALVLGAGIALERALSAITKA